MRDPNRKLILLLWIVVAVLVVGSAIGGFMLVHKADDLTSDNSSLSDDNARLRNQLQQTQMQASASPTPSQAPDATPEPTASPGPSASPGPAVKGASTGPAPASGTPIPH